MMKVCCTCDERAFRLRRLIEDVSAALAPLVSLDMTALVVISTVAHDDRSVRSGEITPFTHSS